MRKLLWFSLGFAAACVLGVFCAPGLLLLLLCAGALLAFVVLSFLRHRHKALFAGSLLALGMAAGFLWFSLYDGVYLHTGRLADSSVVEAQFLVTEEPVQSESGIYVQGYLVLEDRHYGCRLYLDTDTPCVSLGDRLKVTAELQLTTDGGAHAPTWHRAKGIFLLAYGETVEPLEGKIPELLLWPARLRGSIVALLEKLFAGHQLVLAKALLLGQQDGLSFQLQNALSVLGISHVICVSGFHLSVAFGVVHLLTGRSRVLSFFLGTPVIWVFAALAGMTPSAVRSAIMLSMSLLAGLLNRDYDSLTSLSLGALVLMICNPLVVADVGFQLSVGAVGGIILWERPLRNWLMGKLPHTGVWKRPAGFFASSLSVTLSATVLTFPLVALNFGVVSLISPLVNLLLLWAVQLAFYGEMLALLVGAVWLDGGRFLGIVFRVCMEYFCWVVQALSRLPFAALYVEENPYGVALAVFAVGVIAVFVAGRFRGKRVLAWGLSLSLLLTMLFPVLESLTDRYRVTILDVGQGQCVILQSRGRTFLVDCGGTAGVGTGEAAARYLLTQGISAVDGLIITHYDVDHISGAAQLLSRVPADAVYLPYDPQEPACYALGSLASRLYYVQEDMDISWADCSLRLFAPLTVSGTNNSGLSLLYTAGDFDVLITGDMNTDGERVLTATKELPYVELLVAGHHGSRYSTGTCLLEAVKPEILAISVGVNDYGHPDHGVLSRAATFGCTIYRTDESGTLIFRG